MSNHVLQRVFIAFAFVVGVVAFARPASAAPCGGNKQRACCVGEARFGACKRGLVQKAKRNAGKCRNSIFQSSGICVKRKKKPARVVKPCGGTNQRACCVGEARFGACKRGLREKARANSGWCKGARFQSSGICVKRKKKPVRVVKPCGGKNQRACCLGEARFGACKRGLRQVLRRNAGWCRGKLVQSMGVCVPRKTYAPCGGLGQRACCVGEGRNCRRGLREIAGCNGACNCPLGFSNGMCAKRRGRVGEPSIGWKRARRPSRGLRGFADLHMHMFAHLAHGGKVLAGLPSHPRGMKSALASCRGKHGFPHLMVANNASTIGNGTKDMHALKPRNVDSWGGAPLFNGWPTWRSTIHQQVYYRWLERAWRGGLRLMVEHAVSNEALCISTKGVNCSNSMIAIEKQIKATKDMERYIARRGGWFKIVKTPAEARAAIRAGKLAVVQGIEVDNLFNCKLKSRCSKRYIRKQINKYWALGVRHMFPIHNFDNLFGGPATWQDVIEVGNKAVEGAWWRTQQCPRGYGFKLGKKNFTKFIALMFGFKKIGRMPKHPGSASCNARGLSSKGRYLINKLMDVGMIIDIDHMSNKSLNETFGLAARRRPTYPLVASHVQFFDLNHKSIRHERMRTRAQLKKIAANGGMIGAMLKDDFQDTDNIGKKLQVRHGRSVRNNCRHSSKTWAQMLQYAVDIMKAPVAMGSDFNGVAGHIGPRFGSDACGGNKREQVAQRNRLGYPFTIRGFGSFSKQVSGYRTFDFNHDGLAHVGLLPDLVADVKRVGLPQRYIDRLMGSAEKYIQMWERAFRVRQARRRRR